jgi:phage baseplate assembly protein W
LAYKRYPEDEDSQVIGIKFPMNGKGAGSNGGFFNTSRTTEDQAVTNYINLLLTKPGERYHQPNFGIFIQGFIFQQNTEATRTEIEFRIRQQAAYWLPHIVNHNVEVMPRAKPGIVSGDPENAIQIVITFSVTEQNSNKTITIFQENGRISTIVD